MALWWGPEPSVRELGLGEANGVLDELATADFVFHWAPPGVVSNLEGYKQVTTTGITISRTVGGKVVKEWNEMDMMGMMMQLGVVPPPG